MVSDMEAEGLSFSVTYKRLNHARGRTLCDTLAYLFQKTEITKTNDFSIFWKTAYKKIKEMVPVMHGDLALASCY